MKIKTHWTISRGQKLNQLTLIRKAHIVIINVAWFEFHEVIFANLILIKTLIFIEI